VLDSTAQPEKEKSIVYREAPPKKSDKPRKRKKKESKVNTKHRPGK